MINSLLTPLTLYVDATSREDGQFGYSKNGLLVAVAIAGEPMNTTERQEALMSGIEAHVRALVSHNAVRLRIPYASADGWMSRKDLKNSLSPTVAKSLKFVDTTDWLWDGVVTYFRRLIEESVYLEDVRLLNKTIWHFYLLVLSSKCNAEVVLDSEKIVSNIDSLSKSSSFGLESLARLARIREVFVLCQNSFELPALKFNPNAKGKLLRERIDEIYEDSYLLEASRLRRFVGVKENIYTAKRDLRAVLKFIAKNSAWAKGVLEVGTTSIFGGSRSLRAIEQALSLMPEIEQSGSAPVLLRSEIFAQIEGKAPISVIRDPEENVFALS